MPQEGIGVLLAAGAAFCWATAAIFVRISLQYMRATVGTFISLVVGWIMVASLALIFFPEDLFALPAIAFVWFLLAAMINFPIGRFFNFNAVRLAGVARATPILSISPFFTAVIAIIFLGEVITPPIALGTGAIVVGVVLIVTSK
jgi:transporter family protein